MTGDPPTTRERTRGSAEHRLADFAACSRPLMPSLFVWAAVRLPATLHHRLDPDDLVQEICYRALLRFDSFDPALGSFRGWVFGIATRTLAEELRRLRVRRVVLPRRPESLDGLAASVTSLTQQIARRDDLRVLLAHAAQLDRESRELLLFRGLEGLPFAEVGRRLSISASAAETRWRRLRARLREATATDDVLVD